MKKGTKTLLTLAAIGAGALWLRKRSGMAGLGDAQSDCMQSGIPRPGGVSPKSWYPGAFFDDNQGRCVDSSGQFAQLCQGAGGVYSLDRKAQDQCGISGQIVNSVSDLQSIIQQNQSTVAAAAQQRMQQAQQDCVTSGGQWMPAQGTANSYCKGAKEIACGQQQGLWECWDYGSCTCSTPQNSPFVAACVKAGGTAVHVDPTSGMDGDWGQTGCHLPNGKTVTDIKQLPQQPAGNPQQARVLAAATRQYLVNLRSYLVAAIQAYQRHSFLPNHNATSARIALLTAINDYNGAARNFGNLYDLVTSTMPVVAQNVVVNAVLPQWQGPVLTPPAETPLMSGLSQADPISAAIGGAGGAITAVESIFGADPASKAAASSKDIAEMEIKAAREQSLLTGTNILIGVAALGAVLVTYALVKGR